MGGSHEKKKSASVLALRVLLALLLCGAAACIGFIVWQKASINESAQEIADTPVPEAVEDPEPTGEDEPDPLLDNPIDFAALAGENPDIYAWIYIPETNINLPVLQHPSMDNFYIDHDRYGAYAVEGAIYSQMVNAKDFSDPVTLLYGHNLVEGTMFSQLHYFENKDFFAENETMYIYTPGDHLPAAKLLYK